MISVLLPSRGRPEQLRTSIYSLLETARWLPEIEILVRIDDDDPIADVPASCQVISGPRHGYRNLHLYYNELAARASGDWLLIWNDDAVMKTKGWDERISAIRPGIKVLSSGSWCLFPVMSRELFNLLGHVSLNAHCDSWLEAVSAAAGIKVPIELEIDHQRTSGKTSDESDQARNITNPEFFSPQFQGLIQQDAEKTKAALGVYA